MLQQFVRVKPVALCVKGNMNIGNAKKGTKIKCCNYGGEPRAAYKGCEIHKRAVNVQNVRVKEKLTYADTIRKVNTNANSSRKPAPVAQLPAQNVQKCCNVTKDTLLVVKSNFFAFMVEIINCSGQTNSRTERTKSLQKQPRST